MSTVAPISPDPFSPGPRIDLVGASNFRDLGGYASTDGRRVRWRQLFRSSALGGLTAESWTFVTDRLGVRSVCDFRSDGEVEALPDPESHAVDYIRLPMVDAAVDGDLVRGAIMAGDLSGLTPGLLADSTRSMVLDQTAVYRAMIRRAMDPASRPMVVHCASGKDRAGWGAAVMLLTLGVAREVIVEDYLLSNQYLSDETVAVKALIRSVMAETRGCHPREVTDQDLAPLDHVLGVKAEYLRAAFEAIDGRFGSSEEYLIEGLGLEIDDISAFRDDMLE